MNNASKKSKSLSPKILVSCYIASLLEMYDFAIFGFLGAIIHKNYLSFMDKETALFVSYVFFGIGYIFRPLGALIFGHVGDTFGRKISLVTSVSMMGIASLTMFLLPSYKAIGIMACYIIVLVRIIQGISVGGEFTGAIVFAVEHSNKAKAGFVAAIIPAGASSGILLANFVTSILSNPDLPEYSWRFAFLLGFVLALVGFFIRRKLTDTPEFLSIKRARIPLIEGFMKHKIEAFVTICCAAASGAIVYFGGVYLYRLLLEVNPFGNFKFVPILVNGLVVIFLPIFGYISDMFDRKYFVKIASLLTGLFIINCLSPIVKLSEVTFLLVGGIIVYSLLNAAMTASINILVVELFPVKYRMSCSGFFYSIGMGFVGGTVPAVSAYLMKNSDSGVSNISFYLTFLCLFAVLSVSLLSYKKRALSKR